jgi:hypothetical protein
MISFKFFTEEGDQMAVAGLNVDFIRRAEKVISFNLTADDFQSVEYKKEIQWLFTKNFFPAFDINHYAMDTVDISKLNVAINRLKIISKSGYEKLHKYNIKGIGPGEVVMYYLLNKGHLKGGSSAGVDLVVGSAQYEIKAVDISPDGKIANNFKTGGTFSTSDLIDRAEKLKTKVGAGGEGVNGAAIKQIIAKFPKEWKKLEEDYKKRVYDNYFKNHEIIFINNKSTKLGEIAAIKKIQLNDIFFERVTSNVIKPKVAI